MALAGVPSPDLIVLGVFAAGLLFIAVMVWGLWFSLRDDELPSRPAPAPDQPVARGPWHLVEEFLPAVGDQPARWLEVSRTRDRTAAEGDWMRLTRAGRDIEGYRIVTTSAPPPQRRPVRPRSASVQPGKENRAVSFTDSTPSDVPLYERLVRYADTDGVFADVSHRLYVRILGPAGSDPDATGDPFLLPYFRQPDGSLIDRERLERHMTHFLMAALGGPKRYTGRGMAAAHSGRQISDDAFDRVLDHVVAVLTALGLPPGWIAEIGAAVAPLRDAIVTVRPATL